MIDKIKKKYSKNNIYGVIFLLVSKEKVYQNI